MSDAPRRMKPEDLRSRKWFDNPDNPGMTALYLERYVNFGITPEELRSGKPIIGIAQTGSDLSPCNRHHLELAKRVREGIVAAGGVAFEFPCHPIQETGKRPTACLDRNLSYLSLVEVLYGYFLDGVVLLTGCDKTMPACLMAAATVNIPAISLNVGPMLNGYWGKKLSGSGTVVWEARERHATGEIDYDEFMDIVGSSAPSVGHCNTMGTASTMNALAEALGMSLPGSAAIPAPYRERGQAAYRTGRRIVDMVWEDLKPSDIMTREAFENVIVANAAIGGSTNAPIHINAIAKHIGVELDNDDWERIGFEIPLLVNMQPAGHWLGEEYFRAGGLPAVLAELIDAGKIHEGAITANGKSIGENCRGKHTWNREVIYEYNAPLVASAGFLNLKGTMFDSAIMKTCVISKEFHDRFLSNPDDPMAFEGKVAVFDGPEDYHKRLDDPALGIDEHTILIMRGAGPIGYPGAAEVVNMHPPTELLRRNVHALPCIGDGRQSGTSGSPSILNASPEAAAGGGLALLQTGDRIRIDLKKRTADILLPPEELEQRRADLAARGGYAYPASQTPWQEIQRSMVDQLDQGMVLKPAVKFQRVAQTMGVPRDNH
ncbi:IlvD/Edd family dehydratase [Enterovirga rhinocerotis]|uniref:Dihydroxy-acid dehydratase n=1 Tax=Enterovirga rhinocerotis TaxID=1339210 RepID=A0A4R7C8Z9_9HYPH|nr:IlvD/Edd family dehydratase [Enterovirga rhinocerotis]TDR93356.1 dihydroxy-acid dehydratase [Enterovirga rhinocerotis]